MGIASLNPSYKFVVRRTGGWVEAHFADTPSLSLIRLLSQSRTVDTPATSVCLCSLLTRIPQLNSERGANLE
jgi:hypothetical protein